MGALVPVIGGVDAPDVGVERLAAEFVVPDEFPLAWDRRLLANPFFALDDDVFGLDFENLERRALLPRAEYHALDAVALELVHRVRKRALAFLRDPALRGEESLFDDGCFVRGDFYRFRFDRLATVHLHARTDRKLRRVLDDGAHLEPGAEVPAARLGLDSHCAPVSVRQRNGDRAALCEHGLCVVERPEILVASLCHRNDDAVLGHGHDIVGIDRRLLAARPVGEHVREGEATLL